MSMLTLRLCLHNVHGGIIYIHFYIRFMFKLCPLLHYVHIYVMSILTALLGTSLFTDALRQLRTHWSPPPHPKQCSNGHRFWGGLDITLIAYTSHGRPPWRTYNNLSVTRDGSAHHIYQTVHDIRDRLIQFYICIYSLTLKSHLTSAFLTDSLVSRHALPWRRPPYWFLSCTSNMRSNGDI